MGGFRGGGSTSYASLGQVPAGSAPDKSVYETGGAEALTSIAATVIDSGTLSADRLAPATEQISGGLLRYDGTDWSSGFKDANDDAIDAAWTDETGASSASKSSGTTTITVGAATTSDWYNGTYNAARLELKGFLPENSDFEVWCPITGDDAEDTGGTLGILFDDTDADFVQIQRAKDGGTNNIVAARGVATQLYNAAVGAVAGWVKLVWHAGTVRFLYSNNAVGSEPADGDWVQVATYTPTWEPVNLTLFIGALNFATEPGCTIDFGRVTVRWS